MTLFHIVSSVVGIFSQMLDNGTSVISCAGVIQGYQCIPLVSVNMSAHVGEKNWEMNRQIYASCV